MKTYIGLNLGPIYRTISQVRKTRELWAASYLFSWIMKRVLFHLYKEGRESQILTPFLDEVDRGEKSEENIPAGIYSDRLIMEAEEGDYASLQKICKKVVEEELVEKALMAFPDQKEALSGFFKNYFQTQLVQLSIEEGDLMPMATVNAYLDSLGLFPSWTRDEEDDWVYKFLQALNQQGGRLIKKCFGERLNIQSIVELSTADLMTKGEEVNTAYQKIRNSWRGSEEEEDFILQLKKNALIAPHFRSHHKYIAVVHADADNLGKSIAALEGMTQFQEYSEAIVQASKSAVRDIQTYGGLPVYVGGEDVVFFAPVFSGERSIFHLADDINTSYGKAFKDLNKKLGTSIPIPSLSFGISISYYKYPLEEALELSRILCDQKAKKDRIDGKPYAKNAIAFQILKHSGQIFRQILWRESPVYEVFKGLLQQQISSSEKALNSLVHVLEDQASILRLRANELENINYLLKNNFDEGVHEKAHVKAFMYGESETMPGVNSLIYASYQDYGRGLQVVPDTAQKTDLALESLYAILRSIHFLIQEDE